MDRQPGQAASELPVASFSSWPELKRELGRLLQGEVGVFTLDRPVERDSRQVIYATVDTEAPELYFQIRVRGVILRDGEFGARGALCDDKSRLLIARYLKARAVSIATV